MGVVQVLLYLGINRDWSGVGDKPITVIGRCSYPVDEIPEVVEGGVMIYRPVNDNLWWVWLAVIRGGVMRLTLGVGCEYGPSGGTEACARPNCVNSGSFCHTKCWFLSL